MQPRSAFLTVLEQMPERGVLLTEHLRYRETDYAIRGGALLTFNALIISSTVSLLSANGFSIEKYDAFFRMALSITFLLSFLAASLMIVMYIISPHFRLNLKAEDYIEIWERHINQKRRLMLNSALLTLAGSLAFLTLIVKFLQIYIQ